MTETMANPLTNATVAALPTPLGALVSVESQRVIAEVQAAMMLARMNPRDPIAAMDRILNACTRPALAEAAIYQYSRGGTDISGPSIRLAEVLAQSWGNIKTSVRELEQSNGFSTMQVIAWDLESGYQCDKIFQVAHVRHTKQGMKRLEDPRDLYENSANNGARRLRACILAIIPGDVTEAAVQQCEMTMRAKADTSPEAMQKMIDAFKGYGVTREQIEKRIQRRLDAIQPAQVVGLKKVFASLRDGLGVAADFFDVEPQPSPAGQSANDKAKEAVKARMAKKGVDPDTGEIASVEGEKPEVASTKKSYALRAEAINNATSAETAALALDAARGELPEDQLADLGRIFQERWAEK